MDAGAPLLNGSASRLRPGVLYLSYDGALEPLGQSQIVPYLCGLASRGAAITLISFEKPGDRRPPERLQVLHAKLRAHGIRWIPLRYHKRPMLVATTWDLASGFLRAAWVLRSRRVHIVHARSYVMAVVAWGLKHLFGVPFLFDMRGFWADERVEGGLWSSKDWLYRVAKWWERVFLQEADEIVTLTHQARLTVERWPGLRPGRVTVIPTCVDLDRFVSPRPAVPASPPVITYAGSLGTRYPTEEIVGFYLQARRRYPAARLHLLTRDRTEALDVLRRWKLEPPAVTCTEGTPEEMPRWLQQAHLGLALYKPGWARHGTCPTKIGEYLAMGVPVVVNDAVGDANALIEANEVGAVLPELSLRAYDVALDRVAALWRDPQLSLRCRQVAETYFGLSHGVDRYWAIYTRLAGWKARPLRNPKRPPEGEHAMPDGIQAQAAT